LQQWRAGGVKEKKVKVKEKKRKKKGKLKRKSKKIIKKRQKKHAIIFHFIHCNVTCIMNYRQCGVNGSAVRPRSLQTATRCLQSL
jgi:hypothetical protein